MIGYRRIPVLLRSAGRQGRSRRYGGRCLRHRRHAALFAEEFKVIGGGVGGEPKDLQRRRQREDAVLRPLRRRHCHGAVRLLCSAASSWPGASGPGAAAPCGWHGWRVSRASSSTDASLNSWGSAPAAPDCGRHGRKPDAAKMGAAHSLGTYPVCFPRIRPAARCPAPCCRPLDPEGVCPHGTQLTVRFPRMAAAGTPRGTPCAGRAAPHL